MNIDIYGYEEIEGYKTVHAFEGWRVAYLTYADRFDNIKYIERHNETDEIFVLMQGSATLIINEDMEKVEMKKNLIYNIPKGVWHNIRVSKDAVVMIVENADTSKENSEYIYL